MYWNSLTYFGDSMLLLPIGVIIALFIAWKVTGRLTPWAWLFTFGLTGLIVSISKFIFLAWGIGSATYNFTGFSGHTTMSAAIWPVLFWLLTGGYRPLVHRTMVTVGFLLPVLIGISRVILNAHSPSEVVSGLILGMSASGLFLYANRHQKVQKFTLLQLAMLLILPLILLSFGKKATTQNMIEQIAQKVTGHEPWTRARLLAELNK